MKLSVNTIYFFLILLMLSGCADSVSFAQAADIDRLGFWHGLWHGIILPISWVISLFNSDVAIYAINNNGGWYDFGFVLGAGGSGFSINFYSKK